MPSKGWLYYATSCRVDIIIIAHVPHFQQLVKLAVIHTTDAWLDTQSYVKMVTPLHYAAKNDIPYAVEAIFASSLVPSKPVDP